jgi:hypothetical protein
MPVPGLKTHAPTGAVPYPLVLIEGEEHAGKTWTLAEFSRSEKIGEMYVIPLGEGGTIEQYGAIPGARYEVVELENGDYHEVLDAVVAIKTYAAKVKEAGEKPVVLAVDSGSGIWEGLKDWVNVRARDTRTAKSILRDDPNAEIKPGRNLWNDADVRWRRLQRELKTFPGIVIVTARGKEVSATDPNTGQPLVINGKAVKDWSVECHKELKYASDVWVRMKREGGAYVVGVRSVAHGTKPGVAKEPEPIVDKAAEGRMLDWLLFDVLGVNPSTAYVGKYQEFEAGGFTEGELARIEDEQRQTRQPARPQNDRGNGARRGRTREQWLAAIEACFDPDEGRALWREASAAGLLAADLDGIDLGDRIRARVEDLTSGRVARPGTQTARPPAEPAQTEPSAPPPPAAPREAPPEAPGAAEPVPDRAPDPEPAPTDVRTDDEEKPAEVTGAPAEPWESAPAPERPPVPQVPDDDVRDSKLRKATMEALEELFGGAEMCQAAGEQEFGKPLELVGNRAMRDWLTRETRGENR